MRLQHGESGKIGPLGAESCAAEEEFRRMKAQARGASQNRKLRVVRDSDFFPAHRRDRSLCSFGIFQGTYYWFCDNDREYADARQRCQARGMDLAIVEDAAEDDYITSNITEHSYIGATDADVEGDFAWSAYGQRFWTGGLGGTVIGNAYTNWEPGEPNESSSELDCVVKDPPIDNGRWETKKCHGLFAGEAYVCEHVDLCPNDPNKSEPGYCGCGIADADADGDGLPDCVDGCPLDSSRFTGPCAPAAGCTLQEHGGNNYWHCEDPRDWVTAQSICLDAGFGLAEINDVAEDSFLDAMAGSGSGTAWVGGTDATVTDEWRWATTRTLFWQGDASGSSTTYANWAASEPTTGLDCLALYGVGSWRSAECDSVKPYICEELPSALSVGPSRPPTSYPVGDPYDLLRAHIPTMFGFGTAAVTANRASRAVLQANEGTVVSALLATYDSAAASQYGWRRLQVDILASLSSDLALDGLVRIATSPAPNIAIFQEGAITGSRHEHLIRGSAAIGVVALAKNGNAAADDALLELADRGVPIVKLFATGGRLSLGNRSTRAAELRAMLPPEWHYLTLRRANLTAIAQPQPPDAGTEPGEVLAAPDGGVPDGGSGGPD